ncbi:hypothetical protein ISF_09364 [Cordyceps fumosorosea ARSEF 2679]|uniref:Uncharacterized protein n=1 Tax=Cordyceps fumosorosea (strain ARSEF 2679) TaxID=1081104 RepID=A0A162KF48_CORFA|nr:hypothetical protein ISF_09364 [Cordyceps fumosorosea ARSEF 2679]OAA50234.1 hypothetical protein ISF_09364 [Cordyceps fumosorosea ARSEF 2679]
MPPHVTPSPTRRPPSPPVAHRRALTIAFIRASLPTTISPQPHRPQSRPPLFPFLHHRPPSRTIVHYPPLFYVIVFRSRSIAMGGSKKSKKSTKSAKEIIELLLATANNVIENNGRLSERRIRTVQRAKLTSASSSKGAIWRANKYINFKSRVEGECGHLIQRLCTYAIGGDRIKRMVVDDISKLHDFLKKAANDYPLKRAAELLEVETKTQEQKQKQTHGSLDYATSANVEKAQKRLPIVPEIRGEVKAVHWKWSRQAITAGFGEQFANATACAEGRDITIIFPANPALDCVVSFPLDLPTAKSLADALFNIVVNFPGETLSVDDKIMLTCDPTGIGLRRQAEGPITRVLGKRVWEYTQNCQTRQLEKYSGNGTDCVCLSITEKHSTLNVCVALVEVVTKLKPLLDANNT